MTATNTDCLQRSLSIPGVSPRKEYSLWQTFFHQGLLEIVQTGGTSHLITVSKIEGAYSLREQAVSLIAPLLTQAMPVMLEKLACCCRLTIAMIQGFLGSPAVHGSSADCSLLERRLICRALDPVIPSSLNNRGMARVGGNSPRSQRRPT